MALQTTQVRYTQLTGWPLQACGTPTETVFLISTCIILAVACAPRWLVGVPQAQRSSNVAVPPEAARHFEEARKSLGQGDTEAALAAVQEGLKTAPQSAPGLTLLGVINERKGDVVSAEAAFRHALQFDPQSALAHNSLANFYLAQKKADLAEKQFRETLRYHPRDSDANYNLGLLLLARKDARQAITYFSRVQPATPEAQLNLAQAYFATGQKAKATELAHALSEHAKTDVRIHFTLGVLLAGQKQYSDAIHEFEAADALQPATFEILHNLGNAYLKSGNDAKAQEILDRALTLSPDSAETLYLLALANSNQGKDLDALDSLVKAHRVAPANTDVILLMARLSMKEGFYEDAIPLLEEGLKSEPRRPDLLAALGQCYFVSGRVDKAADVFQKLLQVDPSSHSYTFLGVSYRQLGRFEQAEKYLQQGLKLDPHNVHCLYNLGYIAARQGQYELGEKRLKQALEIAPNDADALLELGNLKMREKDFQAAVILLRKCIRIDPHPAPVYYRLATAERNLHQMEAAERDLKIFQTLSKEPPPQPYPFQHLYDYLDKRADLSPEQKNLNDLEQLEQEVKIHSGQPQYLYLLAEAYLKEGRIEEAKQTLTRLDETSQSDFRTTVGVGVLLARYHLYSDAIARFQAALQANPSADDVWYDLADAYFRKRDFASALASAEHVSTEGQKDTSYMALFADVRAHLGQTVEASRLLQQVISKNPDQSQAYLSLAMIQLRDANTLAARGTLQQGLARIPDAGGLLWGMGVVSVMDGQTKAAEDYLAKAVDLLPEWPGSYSALGVLYYQTGQIEKSRDTLQRFAQGGQRGGLDIQRIQQALSAAPENADTRGAHPLSAQDRQQFLQLATAFADQSP